MACCRFFSALRPTHWPVLLLIIGYPVFWLELYVFHNSAGRTTLLAAGLFLLVGGMLAFDRIRTGGIRKIATGVLAIIRMEPRWFVLISAGAASIILAAAFYASFLPPHLAQEFDAINYHIAVPRQHLILQSFSHLPWSAADLFLAPISHALAPYWLATEVPNKIPQFFFFLALPFVAARLANRALPGFPFSGWLAGIAVIGMHAIGIQAGTAMLDITITYLFFAAIDSCQEGAWGLAGIEFAFFFWSKPLMPVFVGIVFLVAFVIVAVMRQARWPRPVFWITFLLTATLIAGPFLWKSWFVAGTPIYPVTVSVLDGNACASPSRLNPLNQIACQWKGMKDGYGHGRSFASFFQHIWLIAVPEKGVNNSFDYPVGLMYLLLLGPFMMFFLRGSGGSPEMWRLALVCVVYWGFWWFGTQQSRFLLVPLTGISIVAASTLARPGRLFLITVLIALSLTALSVVRAHYHDWGRSAYDVLRQEDKDFLDRAKEISAEEILIVNRPDVAFVPVRVDVRGSTSPFVIPADY